MSALRCGVARILLIASWLVWGQALSTTFVFRRKRILYESSMSHLFSVRRMSISFQENISSSRGPIIHSSKPSLATEKITVPRLHGRKERVLTCDVTGLTLSLKPGLARSPKSLPTIGIPPNITGFVKRWISLYRFSAPLRKTLRESLLRQSL
jgi:hypothetical protein